MAEINFNPVDLIYYGADPIDQVFQHGYLIWPTKVSHVHYFRNAYQNPNIEFSVNAGDKVQFYPPVKATDEYSWADYSAGLFKLQGTKLVPVPTLAHMPTNWGVRPGSLDYNPVGDTVQSLSRLGLTVEFDTSGWAAGTYKIIGGNFAEFDPNVVQFTIHVNQSGVPPQMDFQLPDDPWHFPTQTIDVYKGQTILFKYPKNPAPVNNEPAVLGWRHLNFGYIDTVNNQTCEAAFPVGHGTKQVDVFGETAGYSMNYTLFNAKREDNAQAFNIGFWAIKKQDVLVTIRGDATAEFVYVMCYNGNYSTGYQNYSTDKGILYKLHIKDYVKPTAAKIHRPVFTIDPTDAIKYHYTDYVGTDMGVWNPPDYRVPHGSNIQISPPTPQSLGIGIDVAMVYLSDDKGAIVGHPLASDDLNGSGGLQSRYGGLWILPNTIKAGDVLHLNLGVDASYGIPSGTITFT